MSKSMLVDQVAEKLGGSKAEASKAVDAVLSSIGAVTSDGNRITVPGFGTFKVKDRPARTAKNPRTGESIDVPARSELSFKAAKAKA
jgi:DNA-binding protein HU-beta